MTDPGNPSDVPDADRAEQRALLQTSGVTSAGDREANEADVIEQDSVVPLDDDEPV